MSDFSSINKSEEIIAGAKKNDSLACKSNGKDAAAVAGAVIAGVAVAGALAVGAAQSSLFSNGVGASGSTQTAATESINNASSGVTSSTTSAQANATSAITQGPGTGADASLSAAQGDVNSAQADATALAGEIKAGANTLIAESQSRIVSAQKYLAEQVSEVTAYAQSKLGEGQALMTSLTSAALAKIPPKVVGLIKPTAGKTPTPPLPVNVPPPAKVVEQEVPKPASSLAVQAPQNASTPTNTVKSAPATQTAVNEEQLKQVALSKNEVDPCAVRRAQIAGDLSWMADRINNAIGALENLSMLGKSDVKKVSSGFLGWGSTIQNRAGAAYQSIIRYGVPISSSGIYKDEYYSSSEPQELREKIRFGPLIGYENFMIELENAARAVKFRLKCEELEQFAPIIAKKGDLVKVLAKIRLLCDMFINLQNMSEHTTFLKELLPAWEELNTIARFLPDRYIPTQLSK